MSFPLSWVCPTLTCAALTVAKAPKMYVIVWSNILNTLDARSCWRQQDNPSQYLCHSSAKTPEVLSTVVVQVPTPCQNRTELAEMLEKCRVKTVEGCVPAGSNDVGRWTLWLLPSIFSPELLQAASRGLEVVKQLLRAHCDSAKPATSNL